MTNDIRKEGNLNMDKKKDVWMFGNKQQMIRIDALLKGGLCTISTGVILLVIGGISYYKQIHAFQCIEPESTAMNDIFEDLIKNKLK
jgi:hypothetical protein